LNREPRNAVIRYMLAEAYMRVGEASWGIRNFEQAAADAPSWGLPRLRVQLIRVQEMLGRVGPADQRINQELLAYVQRVQKATPFEPETLGMYVTLLSRTGQAVQATQVIQEALKRKLPPKSCWNWSASAARSNWACRRTFWMPYRMSTG